MVTFCLHEKVISEMRIEIVWRRCGALKVNAFRFVKSCQGCPVDAFILVDVLLRSVAGLPLARPGCSCLKSWHQKACRPYRSRLDNISGPLRHTVQVGFF